MKRENTLNKILLSVIIVLLVFAIASIPFLVYLTKFNDGLSSKSSEWSNLGAFLSGTSGTILSSISILALIFTLYKTSKDAQKSHELTLQAIDYSKQQITYMEREFKIKLFNGYIEHFNETLDRKEYFITKYIEEPLGEKVLITAFFEKAYRRLGNEIWARQSNPTEENRRGYDRHLPSQIISEMNFSFASDVRDLYFILDTVDKCLDEELQAILKREYNSKIDEHILFWTIHYAYTYYPPIKEILERNDSLFPMTVRCGQEILLAADHATNKKGPPH